MRAIYVHGVSERPGQPGYRERLRWRQDLFEEIVADPLGWDLTMFADCPWGHLRPPVEIRTGRGLRSQSFGAPSQPSGDQYDEQLRVDNFRTADGSVDTAAFLDAAMMSTPTLTVPERKALRKHIVQLAEAGHRHPCPDPDMQPADLIDDIQRAAPAPTDTSQRFDAQKSDWLLRVVDYWSPKFKLRGMSVRDIVARELGIRWADAIWYVGGGREKVLATIIDGFERHTRGAKDEPIVVLGHSFGALVSFEAINSPEFLELGLHRRGYWALLCLGAQIPIFRQLEIIERERFRPELEGRAKLRNLLDENDPLAFSMSDEDSNLSFLSGAGVVLSHSAYLDSPVALLKVRQALASMLNQWQLDGSAIHV